MRGIQYRSLMAMLTFNVDDSDADDGGSNLSNAGSD